MIVLYARALTDVCGNQNNIMLFRFSTTTVMRRYGDPLHSSTVEYFITVARDGYIRQADNINYSITLWGRAVRPGDNDNIILCFIIYFSPDCAFRHDYGAPRYFILFFSTSVSRPSTTLHR